MLKKYLLLKLMTIINNIEIDNIRYERNEIKNAIVNNEPIEQKLNVIIVVSNPCLYAKRYILAREFIKRMEEDEHDVELYVVELVYPNQKYIITDSKNPKHLQLKSNVPIWHKENMINLGVEKLLPKSWKAFAWVDADIEFENASWAMDTLKVLNGCKDIVQIFSHCVDMDQHFDTLNVFNSFGYKFAKQQKYTSKGYDYWHPGYAWACTRKAYDKIGGLYESAILGSSDNIIALSLISHGLKSVNPLSTDNYKKTILEYENKIKKLRLGYVPGVIRHYFHGSKKNRKYRERWEILVKNNYDPLTYIRRDENGVLEPTEICPQEMLDEIMEYFKERNEDEEFQVL